MEMKRMFVQVVNLTEGKVFSLPTLYTDRTEACVCGQNYIRDRQAESMSEVLFFRVLDAGENGEIAPEYYLWDDQLEEEEDEFDWEDPACQSSRKPVCGNCDNDCQFCPTNYDTDEEPEHGESVFGGMLVTELIDLLRSKTPEAPEEPNYLFEHWND